MRKTNLGFPGDTDGDVSAFSAEDPGLIPGSGRSPWEGNGYPLQYSYLENPLDRGPEWAMVHGIAESNMTEWLSTTIQNKCMVTRGSVRRLGLIYAPCACMLSCPSRVWLFVSLRTGAHQVPLSMEILQARILEWVAMPSHIYTTP